MNKEQIESLVDFVLDQHRKGNHLRTEVTKWFEQNKVEPVVVGLSDEQVHEFLDVWHKSARYNCIEIYKDWAKTQTFAQPAEYAKHTIDNLAAELRKCHKIIKAQQFQPNWDDAPTGATRGTNSTRWWDEKGEYIATTNSVSFERPAPPAPKVEVGQVWSYGVFDVRVIGVNAIVVAYQDINNNDIETTDIRDFLAKFERVGE